MARSAALHAGTRNIRFVGLPTQHHMIHCIHPGMRARQVLQFAAAVDGRICDE